MISLDMIQEGYEAGIIKLIDSPNGDGVVCGIGNNWFYFGGLSAEEMSLEEYRRDIPKEVIIKDIFQVLEDFRKDGDVFEDEYLYYEAFLSEQLKDLESPLTAKKAADFVRENPVLAREIFYFMDREYTKEDVLSKIEDMKGVNPGDFSDEEIDKIASRFENGLEHNDSYWESYWLTVETAIEEVMKEKNLQGEAGWKITDEMVDKALPTITGIGEGEGSGLFGLRDFIVDGERMELVVEICQFEDKEANREYYGVYYWVGYYGDDSLFADWEYTSSLDVVELKKLISDLEARDFTEDIRKCMDKGSVEAVIDDAQERSGASDIFGNRTQELVKD